MVCPCGDRIFDLFGSYLMVCAAGYVAFGCLLMFWVKLR